MCTAGGRWLVLPFGTSTCTHLLPVHPTANCQMGVPGDFARTTVYKTILVIGRNGDRRNRPASDVMSILVNVSMLQYSVLGIAFLWGRVTSLGQEPDPANRGPRSWISTQHSYAP